MKRFIASLMSVLIILSLCSCGSKTQWTDFLKFGGVMYYNADSNVPEALVGSNLGSVSSNPPKNADAKKYKPRENQASYLAVGTKIYSIKNYKKNEYLAVKIDGKYSLYKSDVSREVMFTNESTTEKITTLKNTTVKETTRESVVENKMSTTYPISWNRTTENETHTAKEINTNNRETAASFQNYTMKIVSITEYGFTAETPWSSPISYKVIGKIGDEYCVNDIVEVLAYDKKEIKDGIIEMKASSVSPSDFKLDENVAYKPVIYLYPERKTSVSVKLNYSGRLTYTYPLYRDSWNVTAYPDGTLIGKDGIIHPYLFWEGENSVDYDMSRGFCIKGSDCEKFLREKLTFLGLSENEIKDFLDFWLEKLENNDYNFITFQGKKYISQAELNVNPKPDCIIRVFMVYKPLDNKCYCIPQKLVKGERKGFTLVEWGGSIA